MSVERFCCLVEQMGGITRFCELVNTVIDCDKQSSGAAAGRLYQQKVWNWLKRDLRPLPASYVRFVVEAAQANGIEITREDLRADIFS